MFDFCGNGHIYHGGPQTKPVLFDRVCTHSITCKYVVMRIWAGWGSIGAERFHQSYDIRHPQRNGVEDVHKARMIKAEQLFLFRLRRAHFIWRLEFYRLAAHTIKRWSRRRMMLFSAAPRSPSILATSERRSFDATPS